MRSKQAVKSADSVQAEVLSKKMNGPVGAVCLE